MNYMYSFGRINPYNLFIGGLVKEGTNIGTFKRFKNTETEVYSLNVSDAEYNSIKQLIINMNKKKDSYKFNIKGLVFALFRKRCVRKNKFYCSEFVRYVLEKANIKIKGIQKVIKPEDFRKLNILKLEYRGLLSKYKISTTKTIRACKNIPHILKLNKVAS